MAVITKFRLAEEIKRLIDAGNPPLASRVTFNEIKLSVGQVANSLLKIDYFSTNIPMGEMIPNGAVLGLYEGIEVVKYNNTSKCTLPVKPIKLPRNIGVYSIFKSGDPRCEYIPLEMGHANLIASQPLINDLLGHVGYEVFGNTVVFTQDLTTPPDPFYVDMRLVILDVNEYGDYDPLPLLPEMEWEIKKQVVALYTGEPVADKLVDSGRKEQKGQPIQTQSQP